MLLSAFAEWANMSTPKEAPSPSVSKWRTIVVGMVVLAATLGGALAYEAANYSTLNTQYNHLNAQYQAELRNYSALQSSTTERLGALNATANQYGVVAAAYAHWNSIAARNLSGTTSDYTTTASLQWNGGALNGTYGGVANISKVWQEFFAGSSAIWWSTIAPVSVSVGTTTSQVNATLQFTLTSVANPLDITFVDVAYSLQFNYTPGGWMIASEVWHLVGHGDLTQQSAYALSAAYAHWDAIAIENTSLLGPQYTPTAVLHWIGGPLSGTYSGSSAILGTWGKFFSAWNAVWFYAEAPPTVSLNGGSATVQALVQFPLTPTANPTAIQALTINYTLNFFATPSGWMIQQETWDIVGGIPLANETAYLNALGLTHWDGIVAENLSVVMEQYSGASSLDWVGGTLNGYYNGTTAIGGAWSKFFTAWTGLWLATAETPQVVLTSSGGSVSAPLEFVANATVSGVNSTAFLLVDSTVTYAVSPITGNWSITTEVFHVVGKQPF